MPEDNQKIKSYMQIFKNLKIKFYLINFLVLAVIF